MTRKPRAPAAGHGHNSIDKAKLKALVSRIEAAEDEKIGISEDLRGLYAEARSAGFDAAALRQVIKMRRQDAGERSARQAIVDEYMHAFGDLSDLPLGRSAMGGPA